MARTTRTSNPVTLFPFLAVLMCTIGSLILLLVVVTSQIRKGAVATAKQQQTQPGPPPALPELPPEPVSPAPQEFVQVVPPEPDPEPVPLPTPLPRATPQELARIDELHAMSRQLVAAVDQRSREASAAQRKAAALREQLRLATTGERELAARIQQTRARGESAEKQLREGRVEKRQIEELLIDSEELIEGRQKELASPRFSIIPYDGQTGTIRRPIVLECTGDAIRFAAENIVLKPATLQGYMSDQNPLLAGVLALADYWAETDRASGDGRVLRPYPLLLVRPDGADSFDAARMLLDRLTGNYGYELIEDEFDFALPPTTPEAIERCREAVATAFQLRPSPIRARPAPKAVDSSFVRASPSAARTFFGSDDFRKRGLGSGPGRGAGPGGRGSGSGASGTAAGTDPGMPGLFPSEPATTGEQNGRPGSQGSGSTQQARSATKQPGSPNGDQGAPGGAPSGQKQPFELIDPFATPPGGAPSGSAAGTGTAAGAQGTGSGTASSGDGEGPGQSGSSSGPNASGGQSGPPSSVRGLRRWGISDPNASLELEKKVTLIVRKDRIAVANRYAVTRQPDGSGAEMVNRTVQAMEQVAREWGNPPRRFYWVPSVTLGVAPDAGDIGVLLTNVLRKEGVEVKVVNIAR